MANRRTVKLTNERARALAHRLIDEARDGDCVAIGEETRSDAQNRLMWPLIKDIREQIDGMATFSPDQIKLRFLHALGTELSFLPALEGGGMFPVGQRSSTLTKAQFTGLIELMFAYGERHQVRWSHKSLQAYDERN